MVGHSSRIPYQFFILHIVYKTIVLFCFFMFSCFHVLIRIFTVGSIRHIYVIKCSIFWRFYDDNLAGTHSCLSFGVNPTRIRAISKRTTSLRHFLSIRTFERNSLVRNTRQRADSLLANSAESANDDDKFSRMPASQKPTAELPVTLPPEPPAMSAGVHRERKCADNHNQSIIIIILFAQ